MGVLNEVNENPSLLPTYEDREVLEDVIKEENQEPIPESNLKGISPEQQGGAVLGTDSLPATETQVLPDLTDKAVQEQMAEDQKIWWDMPRGEEKDSARKQWIEKYWGSEKKYNDQFSLYGSSNPLEVIGDTMQTLAAFGEGGPGYLSDLIGLLPGLAGVDNAYDRYTAEIFNNPNMEAVRNVSKIVIPSIISGKS